MAWWRPTTADARGRRWVYREIELLTAEGRGYLALVLAELLLNPYVTFEADGSCTIAGDHVAAPSPHKRGMTFRDWALSGLFVGVVLAFAVTPWVGVAIVCASTLCGAYKRLRPGRTRGAWLSDVYRALDRLPAVGGIAPPVEDPARVASSARPHLARE